MRNILIGFAIIFISTVGFMLGIVYSTATYPDIPVNRAVFGFDGVYEPWKNYPHCQTDLEMSTAWTPELMYLNGIWTAACVTETDKQRELNDAKTK